MNKSDLIVIEGGLDNPNYQMDLEKSPQKCKFCGGKIKKLDEKTLSKMPEKLLKEIGEYTCDCQGYAAYMATVIEEQKLNLYVTQKQMEIKKQRNQLLLNSAFYKDAIEFHPLKKAMEDIVNKEASENETLQERVEDYFKASYDYQINKEKMLEYYFWPVL